MTSKQNKTAVDLTVVAGQLRFLKERIQFFGKRGLSDTFAAGKALEEAAKLLRGNYSSWVKAECGLEPRTALGFRKTFRNLAAHEKMLVEKNVSASVAVMVASAKPEARERAISAIVSGRSLSVKDAKLVVNPSDAPQPTVRAAELKAFEAFLRRRSAALIAEVRQVADLIDGDAEVENLELTVIAARMRALQPLLESLNCAVPNAEADDAPSILLKLNAIAGAAKPEELTSAVKALANLLASETNPEAAIIAESAMPRVVATKHVYDRLSLSSAFRHGLTSFEICAGAGGQAAGLAKAGFQHVGLLEKNPYACQTLRAAFGPEYVIEADLLGYEPHGIGELDLLAGGVPCTPFSQSGKRGGASDKRDMFPEALRLVEQMRPRAVMLENVKGLLEPRNDLYRFSIQAKLKSLGYASEWRVVDATHFGVPQKRIRAILIAFRDHKDMARFVWPTAQHHWADEPHPVVASIIEQLQSRGWVMPLEHQEMMNRAANTLIGGSEKKMGADLGQYNGSIPWVEMNVIRTRIADEPPGPDHVGPVALTNRMLATIQGFPAYYPFNGKKVPVFKQIANAFPTPVAMYLGCAIASALTGKFIDPNVQISHEAFRSALRPVKLYPREDTAVEIGDSSNAKPVRKRVEIPFAQLRATADIGPFAEQDEAVVGPMGWWPVPQTTEDGTKLKQK